MLSGFTVSHGNSVLRETNALKKLARMVKRAEKLYLQKEVKARRDQQVEIEKFVDREYSRNQEAPKPWPLSALLIPPPLAVNDALDDDTEEDEEEYKAIIDFTPLATAPPSPVAVANVGVNRSLGNKRKTARIQTGGKVPRLSLVSKT